MVEKESTEKNIVEILPESSQVSEESKLWSVLSHITMGIVGIIVVFGGVQSVKGNRFNFIHAINSIVNGVLATIVIVIWQLIYVGLGELMGPQSIYDTYWIVMIILIIVFFGGAFYSSIMAAQGKKSRIIWVYPIISRFIPDA